MSKANALAGLIGNYGDSDDDSDDGANPKAIHGRNRRTVDSGIHDVSGPPPPVHTYSAEAGGVHPAPIPHCPWSACYDETSGFTYYWNQQTNAVTWEAPPEYLLALKLAQQHLHTSGTTEVSAEEWQLYQQALAEKQNTQTKVVSKPPTVKPVKNTPSIPSKNSKAPTKRRISDEDEKIELITSYHNSDSDSNDEPDTPVKAPVTVPVVTPKPPKVPKVQPKKPKTKSQPKEYGPSLPKNQNYTVPIGPEIPLEFLGVVEEPKEENKTSPAPVIKEEEKPTPIENDDSQDETLLLTKLKDKAKLLEKLGGELPAELQEIIRDEINSKPSSPIVDSEMTDNKPVADIDDLLQEIEKKELPKVKNKTKVDIFSEVISRDSPKSSPRSNGNVTPPLEEIKTEEIKPLFPSSQNIVDIPTTSLFPIAVPVQENGIDKEVNENTVASEKKGTNLYLMGPGETVEVTTRKKLRISNSVLPPKKVETPAYTTKYSQFIEGFTSERTGLGFSKEESEEAHPNGPKNTISYGNGLMFTKGETLNEDKKDDELDDISDLVEAKLKYLSQLQPNPVSPVQEMMIQMQTLWAALRASALSRSYYARWARACGAALAAHEAAAAPPGWRCSFQRSEGRYRYERCSDGLQQWEYPATAHCDMEICTTPPPPTIEQKEEVLPPLPPPPPAPRPLTPPPPAWADPPPPGCDEPPPPPPPPPPVSHAHFKTPPPPAWADPPPPGCDEPPPPPPPPVSHAHFKTPLTPPEPKQEIGDELLSFYNDIAELEKKPLSAPHTAASSPEPPLPPLPPPDCWDKKEREREREKEKDAKVKKKSKVKISSSIGMKHKSVSSMVAKWQQVAEEINSD